MTDEAWDGANNETITAPDTEMDELATALGGKDESKGTQYCIKYINDAPAFMLPLLMKDSCVRDDGGPSGRVVARLTCDAAVMRHGGIIRGDQHFTTAEVQILGNGSPGAEMVGHQFAGNMRADRALVASVGRGKDREDGFLGTGFLPYLRQIEASNKSTDRGEKIKYDLVMGRSPLQIGDDGAFQWVGPKARVLVAEPTDEDMEMDAMLMQCEAAGGQTAGLMQWTRSKPLHVEDSGEQLLQKPRAIQGTFERTYTHSR